MKRFIRYLYEWGHGERLRNVGFVKIEQSEKNTEITIHGKGICVEGNERLSAHVLIEREKTIYSVCIDAEVCAQSTLNVNFVYAPELVGGEEAYAYICGILVKADNGDEKYIALWEEGLSEKLDSESIPEYKWKEAIEDIEDIDENAKNDIIEKDAEKDIEKEQSSKLKPKYNITKRQRKEISVLPRSEWRFANNNFLLHGYYNYRHLVLIDDGENLRLGVPGIYHEKEARVAATFGFDEFIGEKDIEVALEPGEAQIGQQFGYWCRIVKRN